MRVRMRACEREKEGDECERERSERETGDREKIEREGDKQKDRQKRYSRTNHMQTECTQSHTLALVFSHTPVLWIRREVPEAQSIAMM